MEEMFQLLEEEFQGYTTREVKMHICKDRQLQYDSIFLIDNNGSLVTASDKQIETDKIKEIHIYNLEGFYKSAKQNLKNLEKELKNKGKDYEELEAKLKVEQKEKVELKQQILQITIEKQKELASIEQNLYQAQVNEQYKFKQQLQEFETLMMASKQQLEEQLNKVNAENEKIKQEFGQLQSLMEVEKMDFAKKQEYWLQQKEKIEQSTLEQFQANQALEAQKKQWEIYIAQCDQHNKELEKQLKENKNQFEETSRSICSCMTFKCLLSNLFPYQHCPQMELLHTILRKVFKSIYQIQKQCMHAIMGLRQRIDASNEFMIISKYNRNRSNSNTNKSTMEALHSLQKQELHGQTVREVKMQISKTKKIPYDSFFILDQSDTLITADKPIEDSVQEITVYSLQTYLYKTKRIIVELRQNIQKLDNARFQDSQLAKETAETNFKDLEKAKQDLEDTKKQYDNQLSEKQKEFNDQKEKLNQEIIQLNKKQQEAQTDFSTKIENQKNDYEQQIQNIKTAANAKLEDSIKQYKVEQQTMQQNFNEQIAQANKESEAQLKKQNDESNDKFQKANNDFNEKISSLQQKYDLVLQNHKDDTLKLNNELQNQRKQFEKEESRLSEIINDTKTQLIEERQQFQIQQSTSKSEFEKKLKDIQTEKDSAINSLKNEKEYFGTERQQNLDQRQYIELQIKQLTESKQQNEQTIAQYTQDLQDSNLENIKLKYSIEELNRNLAQQVEYINQQKTQFEAQIQNMKQSFEQSQQDTYYQVQALSYQLNQAQQQGQQLQYQIFQLTEEKTILETQSQNHDKKSKQIISELEQQHETEIEQFRQKLKSSKTANEELEATNQKLIKDKNSIQIELQEKLDELQRANKKYKTLESDYEISKGKVTGDAELQLEQLRVVLREEKNKNESLIVELQKIPQLQKKIDQTELEFQKKKAQNDEEKQQLENQIAQIKKELQTMTANKNDLQNQLQLSKSQEQHLKDRSEKINTEKSEKDKMIQKEFEEVLIQYEELKIKLKEYQAAEIDYLQDLNRIKQENELLRNQKP